MKKSKLINIRPSSVQKMRSSKINKYGYIKISYRILYNPLNR